MRSWCGTAIAILAALPGMLHAQSAQQRSPNINPLWQLQPAQAAFTFAHRFELMNGGDELINLPTLTLAVGLPARFAVGADYTSNSEIVRAKLGGNESQLWLARALPLARAATLDGLLAYNTAARSVDGALTARTRFGALGVLLSGRAFSDLFGSGEGAFAGMAGVVLHATPYLSVSGDIGKVARPDSIPTVWSAGVGVGIPGTRHTFSLHATNSGAATLQGAARSRVLGAGNARFGFTFTAPLGTRAQWARVFRAAPPVELAGDSVAVRIDIRDMAFAPREVRVRVGDVVEWVNLDPVAHTATANGGEFSSPLLNEGGRFRFRAEQAGTFPYYCQPHPQMTGVLIVEAR